MSKLKQQAYKHLPPAYQQTNYFSAKLNPRLVAVQEVLVQQLEEHSGLAFGCVARSAHREEVAHTDTICLHDLLQTPARKWQSVKVPLYLVSIGSSSGEEREHVADLFVTIVAQRALQRIWRQEGHKPL